MLAENEVMAMVVGDIVWLCPCEVRDTEDPETKTFHFKDGCKWGDDSYHKIKFLHLYTFWPEEGDYYGVPVEVPGDRYRILRKLTPPPGYVRVLEVTRRPAPQPAPEPAPVSDEVIKCESAILDALQDEPRTTLYNLKRKTHTERYSEVFEKCLDNLEESGEIRLEQDAAVAKRTWVIYVPEASAPAA